MQLDPTIFREYDIRGIVDENLTVEVVNAVGRAFGTRLTRTGARRAAVGRDVRLSSTPFAEAFAEGLRAAGITPVDVGIVPTPVLYWAIKTLECDGGVMITGSHNPVEYNGLKICAADGALTAEAIQELRSAIESQDFADGQAPAESVEVMPRYLEDLTSRFDFGRSFKVVVDCGNGVAGGVAPTVLERTGHDVTGLYLEPDGTFPNHLPDPEVPEYVRDLIAKVKSEGAACGFGFDGDGDRLGLIDETGRKISADWLLAVFARDLLTRHPGGKVRFDVKCTDFLAEDVKRHGGVPVMGRTGHSILKRDVKSSGAILGGELSGHIVFGREYHLIDDPFFCALRTLEILEREGGTCSSLFEGFPETFSTAEIKAAVPESDKFRIVRELTADFEATHDVITVDGARVVLEDGWGLVRASNTTANLTIRFESRSLEGRERIRAEFLERLRKHPEVDVSKVEAAF